MGTPPGPVFVVVSGPPGSGKSTVAEPLAGALSLPLIAKDTIKEALMDALGAPDVETSKELGAAAIEVMLAVAAASPAGAVLDCNFRRSIAVGELRRMPGTVVEVFCRLDEDVAWERFEARAGTRHPGHFDAERAKGEPWGDEVTEPVAGGWPLLEVDTQEAVDVAAVAAFVRGATG
jgi:predicted kinase